MKRVTLTADDDLLERARTLARAQHKTLNELFRRWLEDYVASAGDAGDFDALMERLRHVRPGRRFTRDKLNERSASYVSRTPFGGFDRGGDCVQS